MKTRRIEHAWHEQRRGEHFSLSSKRVSRDAARARQERRAGSVPVPCCGILQSLP